MKFNAQKQDRDDTAGAGAAGGDAGLNLFPYNFNPGLLPKSLLEVKVCKCIADVPVSYHSAVQRPRKHSLMCASLNACTRDVQTTCQ